MWILWRKKLAQRFVVSRSVFTNLWSQKFWIWRKWRHTSEGRKHFTPGFLCIFLLILWKKNLIMFWPVFWCFELFSRTSESYTKFWIVKLDASDIIHGNEHVTLLFWRTFKLWNYWLIQWWKRIILTQRRALSYRNQSIDKDFRHKRVNQKLLVWPQIPFNVICISIFG